LKATKKTTKKAQPERRSPSEKLLGENLNFSSAEAYKLLRTNLAFCLPAEEENYCPVVGVTSSIQGEGKSTTSVNLAYMLAEDGKRVCLIEGDLRAPTMSNRIKVNQPVGLSHILAGLKTDRNVLTTTPLHPNIRVISAGEMPPNPAELLGSPRMGKLIELLRGMFEYILVDLPPVTVVADALAVSGVLDGMLVVVGEGVVSKHELNDAMQRLSIIRNKILGFAVTHSGSKDARAKKQYTYQARD